MFVLGSNINFKALLKKFNSAEWLYEYALYKQFGKHSRCKGANVHSIVYQVVLKVCEVTEKAH